MTVIRQRLAEYGRRIGARRLTSGAGGNISARDGRLIWVKPSGFAMEDLRGQDLCCVELESGRIIEARYRPTSELPMHLAIYKARPDIHAVFHTHSPWASGLASSGSVLRPMFAEVVNDLGNIAQVPYIQPGGLDLAEAVAAAAVENETILMANHGVVTLGRTMKQAYYRCCVAEDAAISFVAAGIAGKPEILTSEQVDALKQLEAGVYRTRLAEQE